MAGAEDDGCGRMEEFELHRLDRLAGLWDGR